MTRKTTSIVALAMVFMIPSLATAGVFATTTGTGTEDYSIGGRGFQNDYYVGGLDTDFNLSTGDDVIGPSSFKVHGGSLDLNDTRLSVSINTNFVQTPTRSGAQFGDLFLDTFTAGNPYRYDDSLDSGIDPYFGLGDNTLDSSAVTTKWSYAVRMTGDITTPGASGVAELWAIDTDNYLEAVDTSDDYFSRGDWRDGQEVRVNENWNGNSRILGVAASWAADLDTNLLEFTLTPNSSNLSEIFGLTTDHISIGYRWAMTCGNDAIENEVELIMPPGSTRALPEPTSLAIFGLGVLGLSVTRRRRHR